MSTAEAADWPQGAVIEGDAVRFTLFAPGKQRVHLVGDFNGWDPAADPMEAVGDGLWTATKRLAAGSFGYRFLIDGDLSICDPYARRTEWRPREAARRAVVRVGDAPYPWQHTDWRRPALEDLVVYETHVADFTPQGNFRELVERLGYVRGLGVNAIELMPIFGTDEHKGWGYAPCYLFAVHERYGTPEALKWLIDECHGHGLAVILDMVLAHTGHGHPFNRMYPYPESPWYGEGPAGGNAYGLPQLDYRKPPARRFARDVVAFWLEEFRVDGMRFDYTRGIGVSEDGHGIPTLAAAARDADPGAYRIAEHLPEDPPAILGSGMDGAWHIRACQALRALLVEGDRHGYRWDAFERAVAALDPAHEGYGERPAGMVNYAESHDEIRLVRELLDAGFSGGVARRKSALAATVLMTAPGAPMLYHGQAWGEDSPRNMDANRIEWESLATPGGSGLRDHYSRMIRLRHERPALRASGWRLEWADGRRKCAVYRRWDEASGDVVAVAVNFSRHNHRLDVPLGRDARWHELFTNGSHGPRATLQPLVDGYAARVFLAEPRR